METRLQNNMMLHPSFRGYHPYNAAAAMHMKQYQVRSVCETLRHNNDRHLWRMWGGGARDGISSFSCSFFRGELVRYIIGSRPLWEILDPPLDISKTSIKIFDLKKLQNYCVEL